MATTRTVSTTFQGDFIRILDQHRKQCEEVGDYPGARLARQKLKALRQSHQERLLTDLDERQKRELEVVEIQKKRALKKFCEYYDTTKATELQAEHEKQRSQLKDKQIMELHEFDSRFVAERYHPKSSPLVLHQEKQVKTLGLLGNYREAEDLKLLMKRRQQEDFKHTHLQRLKSFAIRHGHFLERQKRERDALKMRLERDVRELALQRAGALKVIEKKYASARQVIENLHAIERQKVLKFVRERYGDFNAPDFAADQMVEDASVRLRAHFAQPQVSPFVDSFIGDPRLPTPQTFVQRMKDHQKMAEASEQTTAESSAPGGAAPGGAREQGGAPAGPSSSSPSGAGPSSARRGDGAGGGGRFPNVGSKVAMRISHTERFRRPTMMSPETCEPSGTKSSRPPLLPEALATARESGAWGGSRGREQRSIGAGGRNPRRGGARATLTSWNLNPSGDGNSPPSGPVVVDRYPYIRAGITHFNRGSSQSCGRPLCTLVVPQGGKASRDSPADADGRSGDEGNVQDS